MPGAVPRQALLVSASLGGSGRGDPTGRWVHEESLQVSPRGRGAGSDMITANRNASNHFHTLPASASDPSKHQCNLAPLAQCWEALMCCLSQ